ncbi:MAG: efflux RND transporter periplasmic adaptor subunit [Burkholderiaceae bacterium]|nr:efflux RND transporter periplasmic adaptor subunit [Burkholderiaceae bacterium]
MTTTRTLPSGGGILLASALTALLWTLGGCGGNEKPAAANAAKAASGAAGHEESSGIKLEPEEVARSGIKLEKITPQVIADTVTVTATIRANQDRMARIAPRVEGRIATLHVNLGDNVKAGQILAVLDSLAVGEASATLIQAQSADRVAEADFKRATALNAEEIIPQKEFLRAKSEHEKAEASLRAAEDRLQLLGVSPKQVNQRVVSTFPILAPFAGTVIEKKVTVGSLASPSESILVVADLSKVWIEANLGETMLSKVRVGANATVTLDAYPGETFVGRVTYVASLLDKDSRTVQARIELENKDGRLKPEMFASATIASTSGKAGTGGQAPEAISVPDAAIILLQGQPTVFVFEHGGYEPRAILPGDKLTGRTIVKSGLTAGEQVVAAGSYALKARLLKSQIGDEH